MRSSLLRLFIVSEHWLRLENILYAFWGFFWLLNGLDKFFNGVPTETPYGTVPFGWFGVNRDEKMVHYFARLGLPEELALGLLYGIAVIEIVIGLAFFVLMAKRTIPGFAQRLTFKLSMLVFLTFSVGDILFGDRQELWEHGTFMILALVTFRLFLEAPVIRKEVVGQHFREFDVDADGRISSVEFDAYIDKVVEDAQAALASRGG